MIPSLSGSLYAYTPFARRCTQAHSHPLSVSETNVGPASAWSNPRYLGRLFWCRRSRWAVNNSPVSLTGSWTCSTATSYPCRVSVAKAREPQPPSRPPHRRLTTQDEGDDGHDILATYNDLSRNVAPAAPTHWLLRSYAGLDVSMDVVHDLFDWMLMR